MNVNLPKNEIFIFHSTDKNNENWTTNRNLANFPRPYRACIFGAPNSGKSSIAKNLILKGYPPFSKIYVWASSSKEWEKYADELIEHDDILDESNILFDDDDSDSETEKIEKEINPKIKKPSRHKLLIIDDIEISKCSRPLKSRLNLLFKHISSHKNLSIITLLQSPDMIGNEILANCNVFLISLNYKDLEGISRLGKKVGLSYQSFKKVYRYIANNIDNKQFSYLVIDNTPNTKNPLSVNFYQPINLDEILKKINEEEKKNITI